MILTRNYDLDIIPGGLPLLIRVSCNDTSSRLVFSLFAGEGVLALPNNLAATIQGREAHKTASYLLEDSTPKVTLDLDKTMTGKKGLLPLEIVLSSGDYILVTTTFYLDVR